MNWSQGQQFPHMDVPFPFSMVPIFIGIVFVWIAGTLLVRLFNYLGDLNKPVEQAEARLVSKRDHIWRHSGSDMMDSNMSSGGQMHSMASDTTYYYCTFEFENGERREFGVPEREFGLLAEGDPGVVKWQGDIYRGFTRQL